MTLKADIALDYLVNKISPQEFAQVFTEVLQRLPARQWTTVVQKVVEEMHRRTGAALRLTPTLKGSLDLIDARAVGTRLHPL